MTIRLLYIISILWFEVILNAQYVQHKEIFIPPLKSGLPIEISLEKAMTGVVFKIHRSLSFEGAYMKTESDTYFLSDDCIQEEGSDSIFSHLVVFPLKITGFLFFPGGITGHISIYFINAGTIQLSLQKNARSFSGEPLCSLPEMIDQQQWRAGLNPPNYTRETHTVHNNIVHHSAGSNTSSNYTDAVRSIYIYHTEVRGWSDIGYNYLIASDGAVYKGRDPGPYGQDNVKGAHFCGSNSGTLGICVMGTFTNTLPSNDALESLEHILAWKINKDGMDALGEHPHALNPHLRVISGHRDGCATECPGQMLYDVLPQTRQNVNNRIIECNRPLPAEFSIGPNPFSSEFIIKTPDTLINYQIYDVSGRMIVKGPLPQVNEYPVKAEGLKPGIYIVKIFTEKAVLTRKIICSK